MSPKNPAGVTAGSTLTYHVYEPAGVSLAASMYAVDGNWNYLFASTVKLAQDAWTTLTFTVPSLQNGLRYFGIEIENGGGTDTTIYLDAVGTGTTGTPSNPQVLTTATGTTTQSSTSTPTTTPTDLDNLDAHDDEQLEQLRARHSSTTTSSSTSQHPVVHDDQFEHFAAPPTSTTTKLNHVHAHNDE